jgi:arginyl-tRNA synthetase
LPRGVAIRFAAEMRVSFNLVADLDAALKSAAGTAGLPDAAAFVPEVRTADARHGDFQANGVLAHAKARKLNPRQLAEKVITALPASIGEIYEVGIAGPGFINFTLKPAAMDPRL